MSDTPQNDDVVIEEGNAVIEINDSVLESDTSNQVQDESNEQVDEVKVAQDKANAAFNKQYGQLKQGERDLATANDQLAKFQQADRDRQAAQVGEIPAMPDAFDDDFDVLRIDDTVFNEAYGIKPKALFAVLKKKFPDPDFTI